MNTIADMCAAEAEILSRANDVGKFAIELGHVPEARVQLALERLQLRGAVRLIDVSPIATMPGKMFRVFLVVMPR